MEPTKKPTATEEIIKQIAEQITTGTLKPCEKLPNERELAKFYNVTRNSVREALRALSITGLITIKPQEGSFVKEKYILLPNETIVWMYHQELHNFDEIYSARQLIETEVYLTCYRNRTPELLQKLKEFSTCLFDIDINEISIEAFNALLEKIDLYIGLNNTNHVYAKLMQTIVFLRKEASLKILELPTSMESAIYYRQKVLSSFFQEDEKNVSKALKNLFKFSIKSLMPPNSTPS